MSPIKRPETNDKPNISNEHGEIPESATLMTQSADVVIK